MEYKQLGNHFVMRVDPGEEILEKIRELCEKEGICAGSAVGLGAANRAVVGLFDTVHKVYKKKELVGPMNACYVSATAEITVTKLEGTIERRMDEEIGLNLYRF